MGKFSDIEKFLTDLDNKYKTKWEAEKQQSESKDSDSGKSESEKGDKNG